MTPGNNGASTPEDDDPFGYLYEDGQANGATPPGGGGGYGYPGSVNRVRAVGERRNAPQQGGQGTYGQQAPTAQYGQRQAYGQQIPQQPQAYGQPNANYAAPETVPGGAPTTRQEAYGQSGGRGRGSNGPNTKGLLIGAIAVVAAVVIGISIAMMSSGSGDDDNSAAGGASSTPSTSQSSSPSETASEQATGELPTIDAKALNLDGGVSLASDVKGSKAGGGIYVNGFNHVGAKVTWTVSGIQDAGDFRLYAGYSIPGTDANATLSVNGKANSQPLGLKNFIGSPKGDYEKGWQSTWAPVTLNKGTNVIEIACNEGNQCDALIDQLWLTQGSDS